MTAYLNCSRCQKPLALADERCPACGEAVPAAARRSALLARAEAQAEAGLYVEAARVLETVLGSDLEVAEAKLLWRRRGTWLLRSGRADYLDAAEAALAESLRLDDGDDLSHQLWIDLLTRRGHLDRAKQWYARRLELNPDDAMARRQQQIIRLSEDFKNTPPPTLELETKHPGFFAKLLKPSKGKLVGAALGAVGSLAQLLWIWMDDGLDGSGDPGSGVVEMASIAKLAKDPWLPFLQLVVLGTYLFWAWKRRRG
jgi:tetratricopeptide (TPR) repeat protein